MAFQCVVVTPEQQVLDETVIQAIVPAHDGQIGILTGRAPLLAKLGVGPLRLDLQGGNERVLVIDGGIAQMRNNRLTILTHEAVAPETIDAQAVRAEFAEASARRVTDEKSYQDRQHRLQRARVLQEVASSARH